MAASPLLGWLFGLILQGSLIAAMVGASSLPTECSGGAVTGMAASGDPLQAAFGFVCFGDLVGGLVGVLGFCGRSPAEPHSSWGQSVVGLRQLLLTHKPCCLHGMGLVDSPALNGGANPSIRIQKKEHMPHF